jgi:predicted site-specific integrase-resolvase
MYLSIGQAADVVGVSISTLRRWELTGNFLPDFRTCGGHRRYLLSRIKAELLNEHKGPEKTANQTICYARVSSSDQKLDLKRQEKRLADYCEEKQWKYNVISDLGSGINFKKQGLNKLLKLICSQQMARLVITHQDRLLRFGSPLLFKLCDYFGIEVIILEKQLTDSFEKTLVADVIEIMTVFTAKIYGKRSHANRNTA